MTFLHVLKILQIEKWEQATRISKSRGIYGSTQKTNFQFSLVKQNFMLPLLEISKENINNKLFEGWIKDFESLQE